MSPSSIGLLPETTNLLLLRALFAFSVCIATAAFVFDPNRGFAKYFSDSVMAIYGFGHGHNDLTRCLKGVEQLMRALFVLVILRSFMYDFVCTRAQRTSTRPQGRCLAVIRCFLLPILRTVYCLASYFLWDQFAGSVLYPMMSEDPMYRAYRDPKMVACVGGDSDACRCIRGDNEACETLG